MAVALKLKQEAQAKYFALFFFVCLFCVHRGAF
jgi:hypothetical protein